MDIFFPFLIPFALALLLALLTPRFVEQAKAGRRRELKLDAIIKHLGINFDPFADLPPEILEHLNEGRKIRAIKAYRMHTGAELKEAKAVIEEMAASIAAK